MIGETVRDLEFVHPSLEPAVDGLAGYVGVALAAAVGVLALNTLSTVAYVAAVRGGTPGAPIGVQFLFTGLALVVATGFAWWRLDPRMRDDAMPLRAPSATELGWALAFVLCGLAASELAIAAASASGFEFRGPDYALTDPVTLAGVLVGPLLFAPLLEEALFRGLLLGTLVDRGWSPPVAGLAAILAFAIPHVWLGVAGAVGIAAWAVFPTLLRLRFNNLAGAILLHFLHNAVVYVGFVWLSVY